MSKIKKSDSTYLKNPTSRLTKKNKKTAYICIGRWQPPHKGHTVLIKKTLELAIENNGHAFVYIFSYRPSITDEWLKDKTQKEIISYSKQRKIKNPLSTTDRLYYMQKMFPEYQTIYNDDGTQYEIPLYHRDYFDFLMTNGVNINRTTDIRGRVVRKIKHGSMSHELVKYLLKLGYKDVKIVVGSDRVENFKKYNPDIDVIQAGDDRGSIGEGKLDDSVSIINPEKIVDLESIYNEPMPDTAINFSGTKMRNYVKTNNTRKFVEGCAIGNMTYQDCLDMMDDVREGMQLNLLSKYNKSSKNQYISNPEKDKPGEIRHMSEAYLDSQTKQDASGFIITGGKQNKKIKKRKRKKLKKTFRKLYKTKKNKKTKKKKLKKTFRKHHKTKKNKKTKRKTNKYKTKNL